MNRLAQYPNITARDLANAVLRAVLRPQPLTVSPAAAAVWRRPLPMPTVVNLDLVLDAERLAQADRLDQQLADAADSDTIREDY